MEPLISFAVPFALASILGLNLRWSFLAGIIAILPDLDVLLHVHRSVSHSLTIPLILILLAIPLWKNTKSRRLFLLSAFSWTSHIILDFAEGFTPILWPISQSSYMLILESRLRIGSSPLISLNLQILEKPYHYGAFTTLDAALFTSGGLLIALLLILLTLLWKRKKLKNSSLAKMERQHKNVGPKL